ncbi:hypothetical protein ES703_98346 [subsurface metagenome]
MKLRPDRGNNHRLLRGLFIRDFLWGRGPFGATIIDPRRGSTQSDINFEFKEASARETARQRAEKIVSRMVLAGVDVTEEQAARIYRRELERVSIKFTRMRYHPSLVYFGLLKRLHWVEKTGEVQPSAVQKNYSGAPGRVYYRLTKKGMEAGDELWSNPLFALYPKFGINHREKLSLPHKG